MDVGVELHYEPVDKENSTGEPEGFIPTTRISYTMLSDITIIWYRMDMPHWQVETTVQQTSVII